MAATLLNRAACLAVVTCACGMLGGCNEYLDRHDRLALGAGDAIAANKAIHTNDPWPRDGFNTAAPTIGQRVVVPVQRYRNNIPASTTSGSGASVASTTAAAASTTAAN